jgi:hypothetical protein
MPAVCLIFPMKTRKIGSIADRTCPFMLKSVCLD